MIGIVDYNAGNIKSVERALDALGIKNIRSSNPKELSVCQKLIFPGDGDASYAMNQLEKTGLGSFLKDWNSAQKPLLGICLGSQIIFEYSEEGDTKCLGFLQGTIRHFSNIWKEENYSGQLLKTPQIGWNDITYENGSSKLLNGISEHSDFYFVHSFVIQPEHNEVVKAFATYGTKVPACVEKNNITAFQFHPEKSGEKGIKILKNFCEM